MQAWLRSLHEQGIPTGEIMKAALGRAKEYAARNPTTSRSNILILNMNHHSRTIFNLNRVFYHREFEMSIWPYALRYGIWVFDHGTVDHTRCDGGWVNWSMCGWFDKVDGFVTFRDAP
jgi:hypothetical protein